MTNNLVSIIIPTFNEEKNIERCLASISKESYKNFEVILVDDNSSDNTVLNAKSISRKLQIGVRVKSFNVHQERGVVRNVGARLAKGDYLFFIDADMELGKNVLRDSSKLINDSKGLGGLIIREESIGEGFWTQCRILEKKCYEGDDSIEAARFFDKKAFWSVGGWDQEMISGEDWDLTRKIREKYRIGRINSSIYHNEGKINPLKTAKKKYYYTLKAIPYLKKNPPTFKTLISFGIRPAYLRNWRLIISDPVHGIGMFILKGVEFSAGIFAFLRLKFS